MDGKGGPFGAENGDKRMEADARLRIISPPNKDRPAQVVAREIVALIRSDFRYNTAELCRLLRCERQWIDLYIRPEVEHIFITPYFQQYILDTVDLDEDEKTMIRHGYYFYSAKGLLEYWNTHAGAERRTMQVDLARFKAAGVNNDQLISERFQHRQTKPCAKEKDRHQAAMQKLLSDRGFAIFRMSGEQTEWTPCPLPELTDDLPLITLPSYRKNHGLGSNTSAINHLLRNGATRIKLGNRQLWLLDNQRYVCPITVQAGLEA